jgi:glycosyltransferase involved in cell wall biosynthesis
VKRFPKIILVFMAVDWPIYMRRPLLYALGAAAKDFGTTVVAVNRPLCPFSTFIKKPGRVMELIGRPHLKQIAEKLFLFSPRYVIHDRVAESVSVLERLNLTALRRSYSHLQSRLGISEPRPLVWFNYPQQGYVMKLFSGSFCVFELYDNLVDYMGHESETVNRLEEEMRRRTDLFLTTSQKLHDKYAVNYKRSFVLGNGLSRKTYELLAAGNGDGIPEIMTIAPPRIGYAGMISERLDWGLITALASLEPKWNFIFVGRVVNQGIQQELKRYGNVWFMGEYEPDRMPAILKSFDVGMMPYLDNAFFHFSNPLKFYEMAAAGLASASSNMAELKKFPSQLVRVVPNQPDLWRDNLRELMAADRNTALKIGREVASQFIWEDMAAKLLKRISNLIA